MARAPSRTRTVYFLGAGFSKAFGLPLTSELLHCLEALASEESGKFLNDGKHLHERLGEVYRHLYPDGQNSGFRPPVMDFFSSLATYIDLSRSFNSTSFPGGNPRGFQRLLKLGIARILIDRTRSIASDHFRAPMLDSIVKPGGIVITSNWDPVVEVAAKLKGVPYRRVRSRDSTVQSQELTLLKLHGSVDWVERRELKGSFDPADYRSLTTLTARREMRGKIPSDPSSVIRVTWDLNDAWRRIKSRSGAPYILTMAAGKADDLGPLEGIWRDAYSLLSSARELHIIGYSMPDDDTEIRTLLRAGVERGTKPPEVYVRNPAPDVHERIRRFVFPDIHSDFTSVTTA